MARSNRDVGIALASRFSVRKALTKGDQQARRTLQADFAPQQRPDEVLLLGEKAKPDFTVGVHAQVGRADEALLDAQLLVTNHDGQLALVAAGEGEMVSGVEACGLVRLEDER